MENAVTKVVAARASGFALAFGLGLVAACGQAPLGWAWLALAAYGAAIALFTFGDCWRLAAWRGWALGLGHFSGALFWIVEPFLVDVARHGWMAPFAVFFMAGGLALFWAVAFGLAVRLGPTAPLRAGWLVVTLCAAEMVRSVVLSGFPWALIGHIWIGAPQMQAAAIVGAHGLGLMTLAAAALPSLLGPRRVAFGVILAVALIALPGAWGKVRLPEGAAAPAEPLVTVRLIQPNALQHQKWAPEMVPVFYQRQLDLTARAPAHGAPQPDVVIWPETAVPWLLQHASGAFAEMAEAAQGAQVLVGVQRRSLDGAWFNTLLALDGDGAVGALYDKHHLVPFGEYMPLMNVFARLGVFGLAANETGGYTAGAGPAILDLGAAGRALPLICYEAIFPNDIARAPERADWMVHVTNDAWFGKLAGPWQHFALARLRTVEQGLPMMRAANTGISAAIDPYGRVYAQVDLGEAGAVDATLAAPLPPTPYSRAGKVPVLAVLAGMILILAARSRRAASG